jgi:hypothetical protein
MKKKAKKIRRNKQSKRVKKCAFSEDATFHHLRGCAMNCPLNNCISHIAAAIVNFIFIWEVMEM